VVAVLAGAFGCATPGGSRGDGPAPGAPAGEGRERVEQQARDALARWERAVADAGEQRPFVPVGELTGQVGDWEPGVGNNHKAALAAGLVTAQGPLPVRAPALARIEWPDGMGRDVPLLPAAEALRAVAKAGAGDCPSCTPLVVTAASLTSGRVATSRGVATVPMWEFTVRGTAVRVTRVAVAEQPLVTVAPPPWDSLNPPAGLSAEAASTVPGTTSLTVMFTGSPRPGDQVCGIDYTAESVESAIAVVVIVVEHPYSGPDGLGPNQGCDAMGASRTATATLAEPLGERTVLEVRQGLPIPVTLLPSPVG
jgi:hypothetical protein